MTHIAPKRRSTAGIEQVLIPKPLDGGWGWVVVFGSFMIHVLADGVTYSFGIFFSQFLDEFKSGKSVTSWIGSILVGVTYGSGPLASGLTNRYGCRPVTILGAVIAACGCILSYFATSVYFLMISFGGITGLGFGLIYLPAIVSVTMYFEKRRAFATGIAVCGSGVGTFLMAPLIKLLIDEYQWRGAMLIIGAMTLNNCLFGALFRPIDIVKEPCYIDLDAVDDDDDDEEEDNKEKVEISDVSLKNNKSTSDDEEDDDCDVLPVVILRHPSNATASIANGDAAVAIGASLPLLTLVETKKQQHNKKLHANARRAVSRDSAPNHRRQRKKSNATTTEMEDDNSSEAANSSVVVETLANVNKYTKSDTHLAIMPLSPVKTSPHAGGADDVARSFASHHSLYLTDRQLSRLGVTTTAGSYSRSVSHNRRRSSGPDSAGHSPRRRRHPRYILDRHPDINLDLIFSEGSRVAVDSSKSHAYLAPFSRRDVFFQGSVVNLDEYKSAPKLYDVNMLNVRPASPTHHHHHAPTVLPDADDVGVSLVPSAQPTERTVSTTTTMTPRRRSWCQKLPEIMQQMLDLSLLKDPVYLLFAISNFLTSIGFNAPYTFLPDRVEKQHAALIIAIVGVANTVGRVVLGLLSDKPYINRLYLYNIALTLCGVFTALSVVNDSIYWLGLYAALFGVSMGCYVSLTSVILVDLLSLEKLTNAFGLLLLFQGIASLIGAPLVGWIYDYTGSYYWPFILLGFVISLSGLMLFAVPPLKRRQMRKQQYLQTTLGDSVSVAGGVDSDDADVAAAAARLDGKKHQKPGSVDAVAAADVNNNDNTAVDDSTTSAAVAVGQARRKRNVSFATDNVVTTNTTKVKI